MRSLKPYKMATSLPLLFVPRVSVYLETAIVTEFEFVPQQGQCLKMDSIRSNK